MPTNPFEDLAVSYVLTEDIEEHDNIAQKAVAAIETPVTTTRSAVAQWVSSINLWMPGRDNSPIDGDDDIISRAKALDFLAKTLELMPNDILRADQVKLIIDFFGSLYSSDHKAGIAAATKAIRRLVAMKFFQASSGNDIIFNLVKLGDDFKRQTPSTRLEAYELILALFANQSVINDLTSRYGAECQFMTKIVELFRTERDPKNLLKWFEIQKFFLQRFSPVEGVVADVFKAFSDYFPITLRASATPTGITADDLKNSVRSCFASHHRIANLAIPFLLHKLDQGEAVTVSVKVDILLTLEACLARYEDVKHGVAPYADQIWASLKYEVRNGEIEDNIEATMKVIGTMTRRLAGDDLQNFFSVAWLDLSQDLDDEAHTGQAGKLLTAILGASRDSFSLFSKPAVTQIVRALKQTGSPSNQSQLLSVLNAILLVRISLVSEENFGVQDETFGDFLFEEVYARLWSLSSSQKSNQQVVIITKLMDGMASLVMQETFSDTKRRRLCSDTTCSQVFTWLGTPSIICPLEDKDFLSGISENDQDELGIVASRALRKVVPMYPSEFRGLLLQFLDSITALVTTEMHPSLNGTVTSIYVAASRLAHIACSELADLDRGALSPIVNFVALIEIFLEGMSRALKARPAYGLPLLDALHIAVRNSFEALKNRFGPSEKTDLSETLTQSLDWSLSLKERILGLPELDKDRASNIEETTASLGNLSIHETQGYFMMLTLFVVAQLYRRAAPLQQTMGAGGKWSVKLGADFGSESVHLEDRYLHHLGRLATYVVRQFSAEMQDKLSLCQDAFGLFQYFNTEKDQIRTWRVNPSDEYRTAPLTLGVLAGLWPSAMRQAYSNGTLAELCIKVMQPELKSSDGTRAALNAILSVLSNKFISTDQDQVANENWTQSFDHLTGGLALVMGRANVHTHDEETSLALFRSALRFLAGDLVRFKVDGPSNGLLRLVCDSAPVEITMGRKLAQCFEILVRKDDTLSKENHAVIKRLSGQWIYQEAALPYLDRCIPSNPTGGEVAPFEERVATNYSVAVFAIIGQLDFKVWRDNAEEIVRITIRSLSKLGTSRDINNVVAVLLKLLDNDPAVLKPHLNSLITRILAVYQMARNVADSAEFIEDREKDPELRRHVAMCRKDCLDFLRRLPSVDTFEASLLLKYRMAVLRGLSLACGDPVRAVREIAIQGRHTWSSGALA